MMYSTYVPKPIISSSLIFLVSKFDSGSEEAGEKVTTDDTIPVIEGGEVCQVMSCLFKC